MVSADGSSQSFGGLTAQIGWFGLRVGGQLALSLHSSNEPGELSQWLCHDDSTINIVLAIIIIIIIKLHVQVIVQFCSCRQTDRQTDTRTDRHTDRQTPVKHYVLRQRLCTVMMKIIRKKEKREKRSFCWSEINIAVGSITRLMLFDNSEPPITSALKVVWLCKMW